MPNSNEHIIIGSITGALVMAGLEIIPQRTALQSSCVNYQHVFGKAVVGAIFGGVAGLLPDIFEPADNPHHRKFFHSEAAGGVLAVWCINLDNLNISWEAKQLIACIFAGYVSHLYLDSKTTMGIPGIKQYLKSLKLTYI